MPGWDGGSHGPAWRRRGGPHPASHPSRGCTPFPPRDPTREPAPYLVHEDIDGRVQRRAALGGHGEEAEAHADIEPLTDAGAVQRLGLVLGLGRVSGRLLARLRTWGETHRAAEPRGWGSRGSPPGPAALHPSRAARSRNPKSCSGSPGWKKKKTPQNKTNKKNPAKPLTIPKKKEKKNQTERSGLPPRVRGDHARSGGEMEAAPAGTIRAVRGVGALNPFSPQKRLKRKKPTPNPQPLKTNKKVKKILNA